MEFYKGREFMFPLFSVGLEISWIQRKKACLSPASLSASVHRRLPPQPSHLVVRGSVVKLMSFLVKDGELSLVVLLD